ncbi:MAG: LPS export ABC transporter permease LptF [Gammaproteobacteria bacterium]|nr:MAG: LPS export ABC transporter permease LptF [Pseudomonadota bacterium]PIE38136.1 MAG: LPS export ABC transporter permease LptF [Gammaproteobacteria bacterium]
MSIVFNYLAKQVLLSMVAVSGVLMLIFMSGRLIKYIAQAAAGGISGDVLLTVMAYRMPGFLELILPLGLFIGILLAYGRMYLESEMTVLYACGMSQNRLIGMTLVISLAVAGVVAWLSLYLAPAGMKKTQEVFAEQARLTVFELLAEGRFQKRADITFYTESLSKGKEELRNVFMYVPTKNGKQSAVTVAETGRLQFDEVTGSRYLVLEKGARFEAAPGQLDLMVFEFDTYGQRIEIPEARNIKKKDEAISTNELWNSDSPKYRALLQWRISLPLLAPVVTLLAISLSRVNPRQGRFFHLLPAMLIYITYLGLLIASRKWVEKEKIPEWIGVWWVHISFFSIAIFNLYGKEWGNKLRNRFSAKN